MSSGTCTVVGCEASVSRAGHKLCKPHWRQDRDGDLDECADCGGLLDVDADDCAACAHAPATSSAEFLSATKLAAAIAEQTDQRLSAQKMNLVLAELGWIEKVTTGGWEATRQGKKLGAAQRRVKRSGIPYVAWPTSILASKALQSSLAELRAPAASGGPGTDAESAGSDGDPETAGELPSFRRKLPTHRAMDGHLVRSRGEVMIDNWLYTQKIVHAYERRLPIDEDVYCDFYVPAGNVYIEYWGMEGKASYDERMATKKAIYEREGLNLISLGNDDITSLDDVLPRELRRYGVAVM